MTTSKKILSSIIIIGMVVLIGLYFYQNSQTGKTDQNSKVIQKTNDQNTPKEAESYKTFIEPFVSLTSDTFEKALQSDDLKIVYMGRETCPHCQVFVPKLHQVHQNHPDVTIYYINTDDSHDLMVAFAQDNGITTVPQLITVRQGKVVNALDIEPETSIDEISTFITDAESL